MYSCLSYLGKCKRCSPDQEWRLSHHSESLGQMGCHSQKDTFPVNNTQNQRAKDGVEHYIKTWKTKKKRWQERSAYICKCVGIFRCTLGLCGWVTQGKDDGPFIQDSHGLDDIMCEQAPSSCHTWMTWEKTLVTVLLRTITTIEAKQKYDQIYFLLEKKKKKNMFFLDFFFFFLPPTYQ